MFFYKTTKVKPPDSRRGFIILPSNHRLRSSYYWTFGTCWKKWRFI